MNIEKEREAFEKFHARECNCDYDELKRRLDRCEELSGHRYLPTSPRHEAWLVWDAAWQASKAQVVPEGFVLIEREKLAMIFETATNALVYHEAPPKHSALSIIQGIARKTMIETKEQNQ